MGDGINAHRLAVRSGDEDLDIIALTGDVDRSIFLFRNSNDVFDVCQFGRVRTYRIEQRVLKHLTLEAFDGLALDAQVSEVPVGRKLVNEGNYIVIGCHAVTGRYSNRQHGAYPNGVYRLLLVSRYPCYLRCRVAVSDDIRVFENLRLEARLLFTVQVDGEQERIRGLGDDKGDGIGLRRHAVLSRYRDGVTADFHFRIRVSRFRRYRRQCRTVRQFNRIVQLVRIERLQLFTIQIDSLQVGIARFGYREGDGINGSMSAVLCRHSDDNRPAGSILNRRTLRVGQDIINRRQTLRAVRQFVLINGLCRLEAGQFG